MIPAFMPKNESFYCYREKTVDDCRKIADDLLLFDISGQVLAVRTDRPKLRRLQNVSTLLSREEYMFFRQQASMCYQRPMLLQAEPGAMLVFGHLFPSAGFFVGVLLRADACDLREAERRGLLGRVLCSERIVGLTGEGDPDAALLAELSAVLPVFSLPTDVPRTPREMLGQLFDHACLLSRLVGCHLHISAAPCAGITNAFALDVHFLDAMLLRIFLFVREWAIDRRCELRILEADGRFFFSASAEGLDERSVPTDIIDLAERRRFPIRIDAVEGHCEVVFSPEIEDVALLGLKNRFLFT